MTEARIRHPASERIKAVLRNLPLVYPAGKWIYRQFRRSDPTVQERILKTIGDKPTVFFVQVGSNDGVHGDPIHDLIVSRPSWSGIFVEPVNFLYQKLRKNYGEAERFVFENVAIGTEKGRKKFYYVSAKAREELDLPYWHDQLGSFDKAHITSGLGDKITPYIVEEDVECLPLNEVLDRNRVDAIDLFHIDTEGFDYKVLSQLDIDRYKPSVIMFEHHLLTDEEFDKARKLLRKTGYRLHYCDGDILALRRSSRI
ncbi:MAG TPA: FkbM family methyltransferase [Pyrinomonadaceae bacterium]|jgi:FkbM family methyltransferase|nr:FkbM family methyltransferase [Pyrinomonadaceae bacterium]